MCRADWTKGQTGRRQGRGGPLCAKTTLTAQSYFQTARCPGPSLAQCLPVHLPPDFPASSVHQASQGSQILGLSGGPTLEGTKYGSPSWFHGHQQPFGKYYWGRTFSHKLRAWFGTWGQSCGAFMLGSVNLQPMLLKTTLLLALESVMRVGYLQAL